MFFNVVAKYALATHLALLVALPGAIAPFISQGALAVLFLWLSVFAFVWLMAEPSVLKGESLSTARDRVRKCMLTDPVFWFLVVAVLFALIRWLNNGVALAYDSEQAVWSVAKPTVDILPASVKDSAFLPFTISLAASVVILGVRHALGLGARVVFGLLSSLIMGLGGLAAVICSICGVERLLMSASVRFDTVGQFGIFFGVWLIIAVACGIFAEARKWRVARLFFVIGVGGNASGLAFFAPPLVAVAFFAFAILYAAYSLAFLKRTGSSGSVARSLAFLLLGVSIPAFFVMAWMPESLKQLKLNALDTTAVFNEIYMQSSEALARIAREMWIGQPWCGVGMDAFSLHVPFIAEKADWVVIPTEPMCAVNSFWTLLAERGIVGVSILAIGFGLLAYFYVARLIEAYTYNSSRDEAMSFMFACAPVVWCPPFCVAILAACGVFTPCLVDEIAVFSFVTPLVLATATFPRKSHKSSEAGNK